MKIVNFLSIVLVFLVCADAHATDMVKIKSTVAYQSGEWEILFDGTGLDNWMGKIDHKPPSSGWKIENGMLYMTGDGGDIITRKKYENFELIFEFNLTKEANSGIKYFVDRVINEVTGQEIINGPEYQIIDDYNNKVVKDDPNGTKSAGAAYLLYPPKNKKLNPPGEWNTGKIIAQNGKVEHWLNGVKVVSYERGNKDFYKRKAETKFKNDVNYGELKHGHILLTDHNDKVFFKNIKIRKL
ncbi:MAG: 3-keto-disaccharide hydrolase [bacterium]